jgi:hypothetical protein
MPTSPSPPAPAKPAKRVLSPYSLVEVGVASVANGFFAALALMDFAVDVYASGDPLRGSFLSSYYAFRHGERVLTSAIAVSAAALPYILYLAVAEDVLGLWQRHRSRHQVGVAMLAALVAVVAFNLFVQRPAEAALTASPRGGAAWSAAAARAWRCHAATLLANVAQLPLPFWKASGAAADAAAGAAAAEPPAALAPTSAAPAPRSLARRRSSSQRR